MESGDGGDGYRVRARTPVVPDRQSQGRSDAQRAAGNRYQLYRWEMTQRGGVRTQGLSGRHRRVTKVNWCFQTQISGPQNWSGYRMKPTDPVMTTVAASRTGTLPPTTPVYIKNMQP